MNKIITILCICLFFSCKSKIPDSKKESENSIENEEVYVDIIGPFSQKDLNYKPHSQWFKENYKNYDLDNKIAKKIKPLMKDIEITVFMGTWCSDSRRDSPAFFKLMDFLKIKCYYLMEMSMGFY